MLFTLESPLKIIFSIQSFYAKLCNLTSFQILRMTSIQKLKLDLIFQQIEDDIFAKTVSKIEIRAHTLLLYSKFHKKIGSKHVAIGTIPT